MAKDREDTRLNLDDKRIREIAEAGFGKKKPRDRSKGGEGEVWWKKESMAPFAFRGDPENPGKVPYRVGHDNRIYLKSGGMGWQPIEMFEEQGEWARMPNYQY